MALGVRFFRFVRWAPVGRRRALSLDQAVAGHSGGVGPSVFARGGVLCDNPAAKDAALKTVALPPRLHSFAGPRQPETSDPRVQPETPIPDRPIHRVPDLVAQESARAPHRRDVGDASARRPSAGQRVVAARPQPLSGDPDRGDPGPAQDPLHRVPKRLLIVYRANRKDGTTHSAVTGLFGCSRRYWY